MSITRAWLCQEQQYRLVIHQTFTQRHCKVSALSCQVISLAKETQFNCCPTLPSDVTAVLPKELQAKKNSHFPTERRTFSLTRRQINISTVPGGE